MRGIQRVLPQTLVLLIIALTSVGVMGAPSFDFHEEPTSAKFMITSFHLPSELEIDQQLRGEAVIANHGDGAATALVELRINNKLENLFDIHLAPGESSTYPIRHTFANKGTYAITVKTAHDSKTEQVSYAVKASNEGQEPSEPPSSGNDQPFSLRTFDSNGDCTIGDGEFFDVIDRWIGSTISEALFFSAVDAWIGQRSVCGAASASFQPILRAQMTSQGVLFSASKLSLSKLSVEVFSLTGELIYSGSSHSSALRWNLRTSSGTAVANGVYLYRVKAENPHGTLALGEIKKLVVLR